MWTKYAVALAVTFPTVANPLALSCDPGLDAAAVTALPKKDYARFELDPLLTCRWRAGDASSTPSRLFRAPKRVDAIEVEVATWLTPGGTTATHIALLNQHLEPVRWVPFESFRERRGNLTARFFLNPGDEVEYVLVGGAASASDQALSRVYSPLSSDVLRFAGVVTARETNARFAFITSGKIRVKIRRSRQTRVDILP